jgi:hypothetical protein
MPRQCPAQEDATMDGNRFDNLTRGMGHGMSRRRALTVLGKGLGAAAGGGALARLRSRPAEAAPYCGNCEQICDTCFEYGNVYACNVCGHCQHGYCTNVPPGSG